MGDQLSRITTPGLESEPLQVGYLPLLMHSALSCLHCLPLHASACITKPGVTASQLMVQGVQDFVKWRGTLVHFFLCALVDDSPDVAALARFILQDTVAAKVGPAVSRMYSVCSSCGDACACCSCLGRGRA